MLLSRKISWFWFVACVTLAYCLLFVTPEFAGNPVSGWRGFMEIAVHWCAVAICCFGVIGAMAVWRMAFAFLFPLLLVLSSILAYYELTMDIQLTPMGIELMMVNDMATWSTVVSPLLITVMVVGLAVGIAVVWLRWRFVSVSHHMDFLMLSCLLMAMPYFFLPRLKSPVTARMPYVFYSAVDGYMGNRVNILEDRHNFEGVAAESDTEDLEVVFVIGESLRADHLSLNGYDRPTTPLLESDSNVVSFPHMRSIHFYTHVSVPHILTAADSLSVDRAYEEQSFITLFKNAGFRTAWISNQDAVSSYAYFLHEADTLIYCRANKSPYDFSKWLDSDIIPHFDSLDHDGKRLTVIHSIGSHWWYPSHYDEGEAVFRPEVKSRILSEVTREDMVNSYDNTVVATDRFISALTDRMKERTAILVYISDHGEALGEAGHYLHGEDYPELHNPACIVWYSDAYAAKYPEKVEALRINAGNRYLTDSMFHTALDAASIRTEAKVDSLSLFFRMN